MAPPLRHRRRSVKPGTAAAAAATTTKSTRNIRSTRLPRTTTRLITFLLLIGLTFVSSNILQGAANHLKRFLSRGEDVAATKETEGDEDMAVNMKQDTVTKKDKTTLKEVIFDESDEERRQWTINDLPKAPGDVEERNPNVIWLNNLVLAWVDGGKDPFNGLSLVVHRNGEAEECGRSGGLNGGNGGGVLDALRAAMGNFEFNMYTSETKYLFDSFLTNALSNNLLPDKVKTCAPTDKIAEEEDSGYTPPGLYQFCDVGKERTTVQPDHDLLVPLSQMEGVYNLPCHFHTREGLRITSLSQFVQLGLDAVPSAECAATGGEEDGDETCAAASQRELHLYAVPAGRQFVFAPSYVGETFELAHVQGPLGLPVSLTVLALSPRVFDVHNFFTPAESAEIVDKAVRETSETHKMKRSSTGASGYNVNSRRTSDNGFDTHGAKAMELKRRCFQVLGMDKYEESFADGLQVLRYNKTNAYIPHLDWIDDPSGRELHDYDSEKLGTNRFATILLYMSDIPEGGGGETVFTRAWPAGQSEEEHVHLSDALEMVRNSPVGEVLQQNSWEEKMTAECSTRLAIKPHASRAVLFYSQHPNGAPDNASLHGACPILKDTQKWAANLWVWNGPRGGYPGAPKNPRISKEEEEKKLEEARVAQISASFSNTGGDERYKEADLYFQDTFWSTLRPGQVSNVNTYKGHEWNVKVDGQVVKTWIIDDVKIQKFAL